MLKLRFVGLVSFGCVDMARFYELVCYKCFIQGVEQCHVKLGFVDMVIFKAPARFCSSAGYPSLPGKSAAISVGVANSAPS